MLFKRISILGVGLLGGSIGMAVKANTSDVHIVGYGHRRQSLDRALEFGAIDRAELDLPAAVCDSELVILCTPVGTFSALMRQIGESVSAGTIVTDVGSTKRTAVKLGESMLPTGVHFVGSHPMAGSERRGVEFARTDLFQNALCITTPTAATDKPALGRVEQFWKSIGMRITRLTPEDHDRLLADISHLPHLVAAALVGMQDPAALELAGAGFLDTTRIAGGDGKLWRDILVDNRDNLRLSIASLKDRLERLEGLLEPERADELAKLLDAAAERRAGVLLRKLREVTPD